MKSFRQFIRESADPSEYSEVDYKETVRMILSDDPVERHFGIQEIGLYSEEERKKIANLILDNKEKIMPSEDRNIGIYDILIEFEELGLVEYFNVPDGPFSTQFLLKDSVVMRKFKDIYNATGLQITIGEIPDDLLRGLLNIQKLLIEGDSPLTPGLAYFKNKYRSMPRDFFKDQTGLTSLEMVNVSIDYIPKAIFLHNHYINSVDFKDCEIGSIDKEAFESYSILELNLKSCGLDSLDYRVFSNIPNIKRIDISSNVLTSLPSFFKNARVDRLEIFNASSNLITEYETDAFKGLKNLRKLILTRNKVDELQKGLFDDLESLETLDISFCELKDIERGTLAPLKNLKRLYIEENNFSPEEIEEIKKEVPKGTDVSIELPF